MLVYLMFQLGCRNSKQAKEEQLKLLLCRSYTLVYVCHTLLRMYGILSELMLACVS